MVGAINGMGQSDEKIRAAGSVTAKLAVWQDAASRIASESLGACPSNDAPAAAAHVGIFRRSFSLHSYHYARETSVEICSMWDALATAIITRTGS